MARSWTKKIMSIDVSGAAKRRGKESGLETYLFSGYARLPEHVSHQELYRRLGVVVEVDESGVILRASCSLTMQTSQDLFTSLIVGKSVLTDREALEVAIRQRYRGHSQGALVSAMHRVFESVDLSEIPQAKEKHAASPAKS